MAIINVKDLTKEFTIVKRDKDRKIAGFFKPEKEIIKAVNHLDLNVESGTSVGFIGPNGAGKSTTIKMLTGILKPTGGTININGLSPWKQRKDFVKQIGVVFGNRSQLWWDLPVNDSFDLLKEVYNIPNIQYKMNRDMFINMLDLESIINKPVRQLSLGQRMRCEIAASFLHNPQIIFLDEPTIGLDLVAKDKIRKFISYLNKENNITVLLTSHDMSDIEAVCNELVIIDHGKIVLRDEVNKIGDIHGKRRFVHVELKEDILITDNRVNVISDIGKFKTLVIELNLISINELMEILTQQTEIIDIGISGTPIEDIVKEIYTS